MFSSTNIHLKMSQADPLKSSKPLIIRRGRCKREKMHPYGITLITRLTRRGLVRMSVK
jgi:hypothetical protein